MTDPAFLVIAAATVIGAILAIEARDLVYGAAALGITFLGVAGLFILLDATYVAAFQIAVYIGAVVVLILFTVMLVGPVKGEAPLEHRRISLMTAVLVSLLLAIGGSLVSSNAFPSGELLCGDSCLLTGSGPTQTTSGLGQTLLLGNGNTAGYAIQIELLSFVLVAAVIGALTLAKTE